MRLSSYLASFFLPIPRSHAKSTKQFYNNNCVLKIYLKGIKQANDCQENTYFSIFYACQGALRFGSEHTLSWVRAHTLLGQSTHLWGLHTVGAQTILKLCHEFWIMGTGVYHDLVSTFLA